MATSDDASGNQATSPSAFYVVIDEAITEVDDDGGVYTACACAHACPEKKIHSTTCAHTRTEKKSSTLHVRTRV